MRRELWETLLDVAEAVQPTGEAEGVLRITGITLDLPLETQVRTRDSKLVILADLPRWRWRTTFDERPGRLLVTLEEGAGL